jgi:hypothetical protein
MATKRKISQSFYNDITGIVQNKGKWHTATSKGEDATPFAEAAKPSYTSLRDGGYADIADSLEKMDYTQALAYLDGFEVDAPKGYAEQLDDLYGRQAYKSDETFDTIVADKDTLFNDWNDYLKDVRTGYTGTDYYNSIAQTYAELGDEAVLGALASGGAENAGNIDSYAKAQAQRQQLAYKNAGEAAALGQYNAIMDNLYKGVTGKGNIAVQGWNAMQDNVTGDQSLYANMYSDLVAADAAVKEAEHNALAEKYKAQTAFENSVYERAYELTDRWAEGLDEAPSPEEYAKYFNDAVTAIAGTQNADTENGGTPYKYTDVGRLEVINLVKGAANNASLSLEARMAEIDKIFSSPLYATIIEGMTDEERNMLVQIANDLQAKIDGQTPTLNDTDRAAVLK